MRQATKPDLGNNRHCPGAQHSLLQTGLLLLPEQGHDMQCLLAHILPVRLAGMEDILEALLLEGLASEELTLTKADWQAIRTEALSGAGKARAK